MPSATVEKPAELAPKAPAACPPRAPPAPPPKARPTIRLVSSPPIKGGTKTNRAAAAAAPPATAAISEGPAAGLPSGSGCERVAPAYAGGVQPGEEVDSPVTVEDSSDDEWGEWGKWGRGQPSTGDQRKTAVYENYAKRIKMQDMPLTNAVPKPDFKPPANLTIRIYTIGWKVSGTQWQHRWKDMCFKGKWCLQKRAATVARELGYHGKVT